MKTWWLGRNLVVQHQSLTLCDCSRVFESPVSAYEVEMERSCKCACMPMKNKNDAGACLERTTLKAIVYKSLSYVNCLLLKTRNSISVLVIENSFIEE